MNWIEKEIAHTKKRIDRIKQNPDPARLQSNALLYECMIEQHEEQLETWRSGSAPFAATLILIEPLLKSMGLHVFDYEHAADRQMIADEYADIMAAEGYPEKSCDRTIVEIGMVIKEDIPPPGFVVAANIGCDPLYYSGLALADRYKAPYYALDVPLEENEESLAYVTEQLRELIAYALDVVPCHKPDEDKLRYYQDVNRQAINYIYEGYKIRRRKPCPLSSLDAFRLPPLPASFPDPDKMLDYHRAFLAELEARAAKPVLEEEKLRVMWTCCGPYFANPFAVLDRKGAHVVIFHFDAVPRLYAKLDPAYGDEQYGRKLTPLEEEARMAFACSWQGKADRWIDSVFDVAKDLDIEAIVNFVQVGCMPTVGIGKLIADRGEAEGIPVLNIEGRQMIARDYNKTSFEAQLEQFADLAIERKGRLTAPVR